MFRSLCYNVRLTELPDTFIGLNGLRVLSIVGLILVFASNVVTLSHDIQAVNHFQSGKASPSSAANATIVGTTSTDYIPNSTVADQPLGVFWAVLNRLLLIFQVVILLLSEIGWPAVFFNRFFPILGEDFGLGALGIIQCLVGSAILSHHVDDFSLVAAFFLFAIGCLNMLVGLIFRQSAKSKRSITSWREHAKNALPTHVAGVDIRPVAAAAPHVVNMFTGSSEKSAKQDAQSGQGFGIKGERAAGLKGFLISRPLESLPRYASTRPGAST
ncbi:unnamed protein product [Mycena citricolor]|uniref:DUF7598 domain-containing protein n=1 Tax=Mycena citricolor TaxID=2018698 RepID=A0AAD2H7N2_9AGAR|nr:unnamed protein product [Mycena citricolor]CAK5284194.1 unnamed protein product [Mycena citricolor]